MTTTELGWTYQPDDVLASWKALVAATLWMPEARLEVEDRYDRIVLVVKLLTPDSYRPDTKVIITHRRPLGEAWGRPIPPQDMERILRGRLREVAQHEADEWILIAGRRPFNPHK